MKNKRSDLGKYTKRDKRVVVAEEWYPTKEDGTVQVFFSPLSDGKFRVSIWGEDDFGLEKDFEKPYEALEVFKRIQHLVTQEQLYSWGFNHA